MSTIKDCREQLINGQWVKGTGGEFNSVNPYTRAPWARLTAASASDVDAAVTAARAAFPAWRKTPGIQRAKLLLRLCELMERDIDLFAQMDTSDNGKIYRENRSQLAYAVRNYRFVAGLADKINGETKPLDKYDTLDFTTREPLGVCALLTAWNSPQSLLGNKMPPAIVTGNTVVIKPSEHTSVSTLHLGRLIVEAGFPPGVINIVTGAAETGQALTSHPDVDKVSFTGGIQAARLIASNAAQKMVPGTYELGGKSANIIFPDANLDRAIPGAVAGIFAAAGQTCVAGSRLLVHESLYERVLQGVTELAAHIRLGNPMDAQTQVGPIAYQGHFERIKAAIAQAISEGARLVAGGDCPKGMEGTLFMAPTIFTDVRSDMRIAQEEVFGPVLAIMKFSTEEEAIALANDTPYALAAGLWTQDINRAHRVAKELFAGTVWINTYRTLGAQAPGGGFRLSGYGRERGTEILLEYTATKNTMIDLSEDVRDPFVVGT